MMHVTARHCEGERRVETLFAQQIADEMLLEHEQRAHFDRTFLKFARQASKLQPVEALRE